MKIFIDESDFKPWSGAIPTYNHLKEEDRLDDFWALLEELYPEGLSDTGVNDTLWFESEWIWESLGMVDPYADPEDEDEDNGYDEFCGRYTCDTCPLKEAENCEKAFSVIADAYNPTIEAVSFATVCTNCDKCPLRGTMSCYDAVLKVEEVLKK